MTTLLTLPVELRLRIFEILFADSSQAGLIDIELYRIYNHATATDWRFGCVPRWRHVERRDLHSLFLVSKQISAEVKKCYLVQLKVSRDLPCRMRKVTSMGNESLKLETLSGHAHQVFSPDKKHAYYLKAGPGVYSDNFSSLFGLNLLRLVKHLHLRSVYGFDGKVITRSQFPCLDLVTVESLVKYCGFKTIEGKYTSGNFALQSHVDPDTLNSDETLEEARAGIYDDRYVEKARWAAKWFTFRHVEHVDVRKFALHLQVSVLVYKAPYKRGDFDIVLIIDHDTGRLVSRCIKPLNVDTPQPRHGPEHGSNTHPISYGIVWPTR